MKKMCRVSARRLSIYIFVWGLLKATKNFPKKSMFKYLKSVKEPKIRMGATRRNLQAQPKILKKLTQHQIYQPKRKVSQKNYI
jgi:hypothetical protein